MHETHETHETHSGGLVDVDIETRETENLLCSAEPKASSSRIPGLAWFDQQFQRTGSAWILTASKVCISSHEDVMKILEVLIRVGTSNAFLSR